jgi:hypothetical protein
MATYYGLEGKNGLKYELNIKQDKLGHIYIENIIPIKPEFPRDRLDTGKIPTQYVLSKKEIKLLNDLYSILWTEGYYDAQNKQIEEFCKLLSDIMTELNKTLHFKL